MINYKDLEKYLFGCDNALVVTPSDSVNFAQVCRRLYIGVTGDVTLIPAGGQAAVLFKAVPVGFLDVHATRVNATGTTATNIVQLW